MFIPLSTVQFDPEKILGGLVRKALWGLKTRAWWGLAFKDFGFRVSKPSLDKTPNRNPYRNS